MGARKMYDPHASDLLRPDRPPEREAPEKVQIFVLRHRAFFVLLGVLAAQLLLLSAQITRNHKVRLIQVWAVAILDPFGRALHSVTETTTGTWRSYRGLLETQEQNRELQIRLASARADIQKLSEQAAEGRRLRELLEFKNQLPFQTVAAEVIAASPGETSNAIFIDKGEDAGLVPDMAVITPAGIVGKTIAVFPRSSQVLLVTATASGVASALERSRVQGIVKGGGQNLCELHYVMNETDVAAGEMILTSGLDQIFPKGLPIGSVAEIREGNIYKSIRIKPAVAFDRLEAVLVVLKPRSSEMQALNAPSRP
jgi:rod shape-determining protein MreC